MRVAAAALIVSSAFATRVPWAQAQSSSPRVSAPAGCGLAAAGATRVLSSSTPCLLATVVGSSFQVSLAGGFHWSTVASSSSALKVSGPDPKTSAGGRVSIIAKRTGSATLTSTGTMVCAAGVACPALARLWSIDVLVGATADSTLTVRVDVGDAGRSITLRVGDRLTLVLGGTSLYLWSAPASSAPAVLFTVNSIGGGVARATFVARGAGRAQVSSTETPRCYPQCLMPSRLWRVSAVVVR